MPQVTVNGSRSDDSEMRRNSTASKLIVGREELDRNGDTSIGDILKRLPGVTMGGRPGRGGEVRMRGLGNGYTQMLVNGERPPAGFSLDALAPEQVERIEVIRGPVAEHSTRAIAGTINIVLREGYQQKDTQLRLSDGIEQGMHAPNLSLTVPGKQGGLSYLLNATVFERRQRDAAVTRNEDVDQASAMPLKEQEVDDGSTRRTLGLHLTPRLSYRFEGGDTLTFQPFLMHSQSASSSDSVLTQSVGLVAPEYYHASGEGSARSTFLRGFGNWVHRSGAPGAKLDVKFGLGLGRSDSDSQRRQYGPGGALQDVVDDSDATRDHSATLGLKYSTPLGSGHSLVGGGDIEGGKRSQSRVSLDNGRPQFADSGDNLAARTQRVAAFAQDEWDIDPQWGVNLGLRWEGIRTNSALPTGEVDNRSSVWSPVLHVVWRIPGHARDQLRWSRTHSYRSPALNDLIALPALSRLNSATRPDRTGNPQLKPELATGMDAAYEHYLAKGGIVSANVFVRDIDDLMRRQLSYQSTPLGQRWVSTPANIGHARTSGVELEAKFQLAEVMDEAANLDLRSNYSHFWSSVDGIPGPDNRLDQQVSQSANLGLDLRLKSLPLTMGASYNWTPASSVQTSLDERVDNGAKRQLDVYALWKFSPATQLRLSAANMLAADYLSGRSVATGTLLQSAQTVARTYSVLSVKLEMRL